MVSFIRKVAKEVIGRFKKLFGRIDIVTKFSKVLGIWKTKKCTRRQRKKLRKN